jgi:hypothetical protein
MPKPALYAARVLRAASRAARCRSPASPVAQRSRTTTKLQMCPRAGSSSGWSARVAGSSAIWPTTSSLDSARTQYTSSSASDSYPSSISSREGPVRPSGATPHSLGGPRRQLWPRLGRHRRLLGGTDRVVVAPIPPASRMRIRKYARLGLRPSGANGAVRISSGGEIRRGPWDDPGGSPHSFWRRVPRA